MPSLTDAERRGARWLALLLIVGTVADLVRSCAPGWTPEPAPVAMPEPPAARANSVPVAPAGPAVVDLDRATVQELDALPGIGPVLARRIVEHRQAHGGFRSVDELLAVPGIGPRLLERLRPLVRTGSAPAR